MFVETSGVAEFVAASVEVCGRLVELVEAFDLALEPCLCAAVVLEQVFVACADATGFGVPVVDFLFDACRECGCGGAKLVLDLAEAGVRAVAA
jgi:hypothetical protein